MEDSIEYKLIKINDLYLEEKELKNKYKNDQIKLQKETKDRIESLTGEEVYKLLEEKWIKPIRENIISILDEVISEFSKNIQSLSNKYEETFEDLENEIAITEKSLSSMIDELTGNAFDMKGLEEFKSLLNGDKHE